MTRTMALAGLLSVALFAQQPKDPAHPFPNHEEPPAGWYCTPDAKQADHRCACKNMPTQPHDPICSTMEPEDDPGCKVYCHKDHCLCKIRCEES